MTKENFIKSMNIIIDTFEGIDEVYKDTKDVLDLSKIDFMNRPSIKSFCFFKIKSRVVGVKENKRKRIINY